VIRTRDNYLGKLYSSEQQIQHYKLVVTDAIIFVFAEQNVDVAMYCVADLATAMWLTQK